MSNNIEQYYKTMISQLTIEELILFKNTSPMIDDYEWNFIWDEIIPNKSGSVYEEIKYYYNIRVLPFIR